MIASNFGPQILVEGFGLSLTQASRYGKLEDYLLEEQIRSERDFIKENSNGEIVMIEEYNPEWAVYRLFF